MMTHYCPRCQRFIVAVEDKCPQCGNEIRGSSGSEFFISQACPRQPGIDLEPDTKLVDDRFTISARIGSGGFSTVYLAQDTVRSEQVALKIVALGPESPDDAALQLRQETVLHTRITDYRHVVRVHDIHFQPWSGVGLLILSMEYADGGTFRAWLLNHRIDWEARSSQGIEYFTQMCMGVAAFHEAGIVHGDLKPENALFCGPVLKVADFGIARLAQMLQSTRAALPFPTDRDMGTLTYSSPEQILAAHPDDIDSRSDIYTLGVILHEIIHPKGRPPFGGSPKRLRELHVEVSAPPVPDAPPIEARVVERCLAKNPTDRYATVWDLLDDLEGKTSAIGCLHSDAIAIEQDPGEDNAEEMWQQACRWYSRGDLNEAARQCEAVLRSHPDHAEAQRLAKELRDRSRQAEQFYETIVQELGHRPISELAALIAEAVQIYPDHPVGRLVQTRVASRAREYRERIQEGLQALRAGMWDAAIICFQRAQQLNAGAPGLARAVGTVSEIQEHVRSIRAHIDEAIGQRNRERAMSLARCLDQYREELVVSFGALVAGDENG